jgi:hypothetical protein
MQVRKIANLEDEYSGKGFEVFEAQKAGAHEAVTLRIERDRSVRSEVLYKELLSANIKLPRQVDQAHQELAAIVKMEPEEYWLQAGAGDGAKTAVRLCSAKTRLVDIAMTGFCHRLLACSSGACGFEQ